DSSACSTGGGTSLGLGGALAGLLFGLLGWRRRRR
ncbi:MAG: MYXO-CTERM sorting domain-containing protein, partial [Persicimonas sp.]